MDSAVEAGSRYRHAGSCLKIRGHSNQVIVQSLQVYVEICIKLHCETHKDPFVAIGSGCKAELL